MRWLLLALVMAGSAGCRSRSDLVEAELRTRDRQLRQLRGELDSTNAMNEALENTLRDQRTTYPASRPTSGGLVVKDIQIGRGTGGVDEDRTPGDEALQIVVVPRDAEGSAIKAPGSLRVIAMEVTPEGLKVPLSSWEVSAAQLRKSWKGGLLSTGYQVVLPWQRGPNFDKVRVEVTFTALDGTAFADEKTVQIRLAPGTRGLTPPMPPAVPIDSGAPVLPEPTPILPVNRTRPSVSLLPPVVAPDYGYPR